MIYLPRLVPVMTKSMADPPSPRLRRTGKRPWHPPLIERESIIPAKAKDYFASMISTSTPFMNFGFRKAYFDW